MSALSAARDGSPCCLCLALAPRHWNVSKPAARLGMGPLTVWPSTITIRLIPLIRKATDSTSASAFALTFPKHTLSHLGDSYISISKVISVILFSVGERLIFHCYHTKQSDICLIDLSFLLGFSSRGRTKSISATCHPSLRLFLPVPSLPTIVIPCFLFSSFFLYHYHWVA